MMSCSFFCWVWRDYQMEATEEIVGGTYYNLKMLGLGEKKLPQAYLPFKGALFYLFTLRRSQVAVKGP